MAKGLKVAQRPERRAGARRSIDKREKIEPQFHLGSRDASSAQAFPPSSNVHAVPLLFHLEHDRSVLNDVASQHPEVVAELRGLQQEITVERVVAQVETPMTSVANRGGMIPVGHDLEPYLPRTERPNVTVQSGSFLRRYRRVPSRLSQKTSKRSGIRIPDLLALRGHRRRVLEQRFARLKRPRDRPRPRRRMFNRNCRSVRHRTGTFVREQEARMGDSTTRIPCFTRR